MSSIVGDTIITFLLENAIGLVIITPLCCVCIRCMFWPSQMLSVSPPQLVCLIGKLYGSSSHYLEVENLCNWAKSCFFHHKSFPRKNLSFTVFSNCLNQDEHQTLMLLWFAEIVFGIHQTSTLTCLFWSCISCQFSWNSMICFLSINKNHTKLNEKPVAHHVSIDSYACNNIKVNISVNSYYSGEMRILCYVFSRLWKFWFWFLLYMWTLHCKYERLIWLLVNKKYVLENVDFILILFWVQNKIIMFLRLLLKFVQFEIILSV